MSGPRIKIVFAIGTLDVGGAERQLVELVTHLDRDRFEPSVCVLAGDGPLGEMLRSAAIPVYHLGFRGFRRPWLAALGLLRLWRIMRRERPQIFHGFLFWAYITGTLVARFARVPVVVASRRSLGHFKAGKRHYLILEQFTNRVTDLFVANSQAVKQDVMTQENIDGDRIIVIYNGLDATRYHNASGEALRRELQLGSKPVVAVVSNFIHYKGHAFFFEAWRHVTARHPSAIALLVGEGATRPMWERWCQDAGLLDSVRFLGTRQDVPCVLAAATVFVHPSLEEGYSNAVLEAMASSLPIVATAVGGNVEAIEHERTGLLIPPRDSTALAEAISRLLADPKVASRLGRAACQAVTERHRLSRMVREYETVYESLIASSARTREDAYVWHRRSI